jgi:uncharacterized protein (DUF1778 family)
MRADEARVIEKAAAARGIPVSKFVREAALALAKENA